MALGIPAMCLVAAVFLVVAGWGREAVRAHRLNVNAARPPCPSGGENRIRRETL